MADKASASSVCRSDCVCEDCGLYWCGDLSVCPDCASISTTVVHCKISPYDVYIGRPSKWGNDFSHKEGTLALWKVDTQEDAVLRYEEWIMGRPDLIEAAKTELKGKTLGCWCKPLHKGFRGKLLCHGQILAKIAES